MAGKRGRRAARPAKRKSPKRVLWEQHRDRARKQIQKYQEMEVLYGEKWRSGMLRHWKRVLAEIEAREPEE